MREPAPRRHAAPDDLAEPPRERVTAEEYRAFAAAHRGAYEHIGGFVYSKGVPSATHTRVAGNVFGHLWVAARGTGCRVYQDRGAVRVGPDTFLPDVFVACGGPEGDPETAPCLVVEVLSPGTALADRTTRREAYTSLASVRAYWIVSQDWRSVERHWRDAGGAWRWEAVRGDGALDVPCPARAPLTLTEVYEGLDVPGVPPPPRRVREPEGEDWPEPAGT